MAGEAPCRDQWGRVVMVVTHRLKGMSEGRPSAEFYTTDRKRTAVATSASGVLLLSVAKTDISGGSGCQSTLKTSLPVGKTGKQRFAKDGGCRLRGECGRRGFVVTCASAVSPLLEVAPVFRDVPAPMARYRGAGGAMRSPRIGTGTTGVESGRTGVKSVKVLKFGAGVADVGGCGDGGVCQEESGETEPGCSGGVSGCGGGGGGGRVSVATNLRLLPGARVQVVAEQTGRTCGRSRQDGGGDGVGDGGGNSRVDASILCIVRQHNAVAAAMRLGGRRTRTAGIWRDKVGLGFGDVAVLEVALEPCAARCSCGIRSSWQSCSDHGLVLPCFPPCSLSTTDGSSCLGVGQARVCAHLPRRGEPMWQVASPFGLLSPDVFMNNVTSSVVCNHISAQGHGDAPIIATDAGFFAGQEGGGCFNHEGQLVGIAAAPPVVGKRRLTDITLLYPAVSLVVQVGGAINMLRGSNLADGRATENIVRGLPIQGRRDMRDVTPKMLRPAFRSLVVIQASHQWASGIMVSPRGDILTCAHLFDKQGSGTHVKPTARNVPGHVRVGVDTVTEDGRVNRVYFLAVVLYCSNGPLDVAMIRLRPMSQHSTPFPFVPCDDHFRGGLIERGSCVFALGHALIGPDVEICPTICHGIVSHVSFDGDMPAMITSCASVHSGHSGGMLLSSSGRLVGMLTSNSVSAEGTIIPRINFSLPCSLLAEIVDACVPHETAVDKLVARRLDRSRPNVERLWELTAGVVTPTPLTPQQAALEARL